MRENEEPGEAIGHPSRLEEEGQLHKRSAVKQGCGAGQHSHAHPSGAPSPCFEAETSKRSLSLKRRGGMAITLAVVALVLFCSSPTHAQEGALSLFDGQTLNGWTTMDGQPVTQGWEVVDGMIHLPASDERSGNIITARDIGNFTLSFDFKIAPGGNSGIKYRVQDINGKMLGCEYQIFDDDHPTKSIAAKNSTGSLYDVYPPVDNKSLNPAGEWNSAKIVVQDYWIEHWLNGQLILKVLVGSHEWHCRIADSKFDDDPGFGQNRFGRLMLTDHGSEVWYRIHEFEELPTTPAPASVVASSGCCGPATISDCCQSGLVMTSRPTSARLHARPRRVCRIRRLR